jgi:hypothetical protein
MGELLVSETASDQHPYARSANSQQGKSFPIFHRLSPFHHTARGCQTDSLPETKLTPCLQAGYRELSNEATHTRGEA